MCPSKVSNWNWPFQPMVCWNPNKILLSFWEMKRHTESTKMRHPPLLRSSQWVSFYLKLEQISNGYPSLLNLFHQHYVLEQVCVVMTQFCVLSFLFNFYWTSQKGRFDYCLHLNLIFIYAFHLKLNCFEFANVKAGVYKKNGLHTSVDFMIYI